MNTITPSQSVTLLVKFFYTLDRRKEHVSPSVNT